MVITRPLVLDPNDFRQPSCILPGRDAAVVVLSGSRCRLKRDVHYFARACEEGGQRLLSITDSNDRELVSASSLAVLLPSLGEMAGSVLALIALVAAAYEAST
jgi:DNA-binding MurR/RpiR family transcriptional regulator